LYLHDALVVLFNVKRLVEKPSDEHADHFIADMGEAQSA
jgi:hypothetical protein